MILINSWESEAYQGCGEEGEMGTQTLLEMVLILALVCVGVACVATSQSIQSFQSSCISTSQ